MENLVTFLLTALCFFCQTSNCQDYSSCGLRSVRRGKIFGGLQSRPGMWPWQVAIFRKNSDEDQKPQFFCGGALINSRWVLSAAHCFHKRQNEKYVHYRYTIKAGDHKIYSKDPYEQERDARIHNHPNFIPSTFENDVALVELDKGVKMGPNVRSICLPKSNENLSSPGEIVSVAGWGYTTKGSHSSVLLHSAFEIQNNKNCKDTTTYEFNKTVMFCAGHGKGGNDTCKGDSGGSTVREVLRDGRRRWVTVGLVSWGEGCGIKGKYGYYTRVKPFVDWIQKKINGSILSCGDPGNIPNGRINGTDFLVGFTVKYKCNEGYQLRGRSKSRCKRNGKWTKAPTCQKVECNDPGSLRHGVRRPRKKKYYYKDKIRFRCKTNYTIIGRSAMVCRSNGMWSGFKPACLAPCKDPGIPEGGVRLDHSFKHAQTVRFLCKKRNQPPSVSYVSCSNGRWNQNIPRCIADCDDPGIPTNGKRQSNDFTLKKRVYFTCDRGYMRVGPEYIQCQSNRRWSDKAPICEPLSCFRPIPPENAYIYSRRQWKEKYGFNEVVMFYCNKGHFASGSPFVRCLANGWSKTNLRCPPKNCGDPGTPTNGRRQGNVFTFNNKVNFTCSDGYELEGPAQRVCQENGSWSGNTTTCERVECKDPGTPRNGIRRPEKNKYVYEDRLDFRCNTNYNLRENTSIICQSDRTWTGAVPVCLEGCQRPKRPDNGNIYREKVFYKHRERIRYYCNYGYQRMGTQYSTCEKGRWKEQTPTCKRKCGYPGRPDNGYSRGSDLYEGREIRFYCNRGFDLIGSQTTRCLATGRWSEPRPACKRRCYSPRFTNSIPNPSLRQNRKTLHGTNITFSCSQQSYTLDGPSVIYCINGRWNYNVPVCRASCLKPWDLPNGQKAGDNYAHGQKVTYSCLGLYTLVGSSSITCNNGKWVLNRLNQWPSCKKPCPNPGTPSKGSKTGSDYRHGRQVFYTCERGTKMIGERSSTCYNGKWSNVLPACLKICQDPGAIVNGYKTENPRLYLSGDRVTYRCNYGYDLVGRAELVCKDDGQWNDNVPICYGQCKVPSNVTGVQSQPSVNANEFLSHKTTISFYCTKDKQLVGPKEVVCEDGSWSMRFPTCQEDCDDPGQPTDGTKNSTDYRHGKVVSFQCLRGFRLEGSTTVTCSDGTWSSRIPRCIAPCPNPGQPTNGRRKGNNFGHGAAVQFFCDSGYELFGAQTLRCNDGSWSHPVPTCETGCSNLIIPKGMTTQGNLGRSRTSISFSCTLPLVLVGKSVLTCINGNWSDILPVCSECGSALGMENGKIPDSNIRASSTRWNYHAKDGRLNGRYAWCSGTARDPYLQIDFGKPYRITGLATQGSAYDNKWVETYTVTSNLAGSSFNIYGEDGRDKIFTGNRDKGSVVKNKLRNPVIARRLRIYPQKQGGFSSLSPACMRVEIYGCELPSDCILIKSRIVAKWTNNPGGANQYLKAYITSVSRRYWRVELEDESHVRPRYKYVLKYEDLPFVLDVPPKHEELQVGTRVLGAWGYRYFTSTIKTGRDRYNSYRVRADDGDEKVFTLDGIRVLKAPTFCS